MSFVTQSCSTLCGCMNCGPPGSSVHGLFQARILNTELGCRFFLLRVFRSFFFCLFVFLGKNFSVFLYSTQWCKREYFSTVVWNPVLDVSALGLDILLCYSKINVAKFQSLSIGSLSVVMIGYCHHSLST